MRIALLKGLLRLLVICWPIYAFFIARWMGDQAWVIAASHNSALAAFWQTAPGFGRALGPVLLLGLVLVLCLVQITGKPMLKVAMLTLVASIAWSLVFEYARLAPYFGSHRFWDVALAFDRGPVVAALVAAVAIVVSNRLADGRPLLRPNGVSRSTSGVHGNANWMAMDRAKSLLGKGDIILGEAYRVDHTKVADTVFDPNNAGTWGEGGTHALLSTEGLMDSGHVLAVMGSGGGKTASLVIPTAASWQSGLVVLDVKGEVHDRVGRLRESWGRRVVTIRPGDRSSSSFNALDWIDPSSDKAIMDVMRVVTWLMGEKAEESSSNEYFRASAASLVAVVIADVVFNTELLPHEKNLRTVRRLLTNPRDDVVEHLNGVYAKGADYGFGFPAEIAGNLKDITAKQFDGFYGQAGTATRWLSVPSFADVVCGLTSEVFRTRELRTGNLDVFLCIDLGTLIDTPELARIVLGSLLNELYNAKGKVPGRTLFLIDEAARLGYMKMLEEARDAGRGFKINLMLMFQTIGQLELYGRAGVKQWFDVAAIKAFSSIGDPETADYISRTCGDFTAIASGRNTSAGASHRKDELYGSGNRTSGSSTSEVSRRLIKPEEVMALRGDEQLLVVKGQQPIRCGKAFWFRRADLKTKISNSSFEGGR